MNAESFSYGENCDRVFRVHNYQEIVDYVAVAEDCIYNGIVKVTRFGYLVNFDEIAETSEYAYAI